jgi:hypothetical protein
MPQRTSVLQNRFKCWVCCNIIYYLTGAI